MDLDQISLDHRVMGGVPCVAGTRIPVTTVVGMIANGLSTDQILAHYPQLAAADIQACLACAAAVVDELPVRLFESCRRHQVRGTNSNASAQWLHLSASLSPAMMQWHSRCCVPCVSGGEGLILRRTGPMDALQER